MTGLGRTKSSSTRPGSPICAGALALLSALPAGPQVTFRDEVNLFSVAVRVTDGKGRDVRNLTAGDFTVLEERRPQKIAFFAAEQQPMSLAILLDTSTSMKFSGKLEQAKAALGKLFEAGRPDNQVFYGEFSNEVESFGEWTSDRRVGSRISRPAAATGGTALYDAITVALCHLRRARHARQVLVVVTDGADQHSRLTLDEAVGSVQASPAQVFLVGYFSGAEHGLFQEGGKTITLATGREIDNPLHVFDRLARESGAEAFFPTSEGRFERAVEALRNSLLTQYSLAYYPAPSSKRYRRVEVRVNRRGVKIRARHGFSTPGANQNAALPAPAGGCVIPAEKHPYPYEGRLTQVDGRLVYREDFANPATGWPNRKGSRYGAGVYHILRGRRSVAGGATAGTNVFGRSETDLGRPGQTTGPRGDGTLAAYGPWWEDFRASVAVELAGTTGGDSGPEYPAAAGIAFRVNDTGYYALLISGRYWKLARETFYGAEADLVPWTPALVRPGSLHQVAVEGRGDLLTLFLDNQQVGKVRDGSYETGMVGMVLFGNGHAVFRELAAEEMKKQR